MAFAQGCRAATLEATALFTFAPVNNFETGKTGICAIVSKVKRALSDSINPASGFQGEGRIKDQSILFKDYFDGIVQIEFKGSLIGGEGELISCFHMTPPLPG